jgi:hypothetical protein
MIARTDHVSRELSRDLGSRTALLRQRLRCVFRSECCGSHEAAKAL